MEYKRAVCHHSSHTGPRKEEGGVLSVFVSLLAEPLSKQGATRTDSDHLTIELVLHLFRNLLSAEPLLYTSTDTLQQSQQLHHEFITLLDRELVLDILLVLGADIEQRENAQYNLLLMELLHHMLRSQDPAAVARSRRAAAVPGPQGGSLLKNQLQREKQCLQVATSSRHSHFSGTLQMKQRPGAPRGQYRSTQSLLQDNSNNNMPTRRKNKKTDPFLGAAGNLQMHRRGKETTPAARRAGVTLDRFCQRFVKDCYGPFTKCLKNEFRRDSVRLEDGDRVVFFRVVWFFKQWWRAGGRKSMSTTAGEDQGGSNLGQLIFTMDLFTFKLVLNATDTFQQHKKYARLAQSVALLSEMMHLLHVMYQSKESTEQIMAMGLMDRLFYANEPLDRLPKLLSNWAPGTFTREYLCDLVEICHVSLKILDEHAKACSDVDRDASFTSKKRKKDTKQMDTIAKMKAAAADFDTSAYFARRIVSNQTVYMYTQLLSQYAINATQVNHRIIAFFTRMCKLKVAVAESADPEMPQNLLALKTVSLQPMLYNVLLLNVLNTILNDSSIRKDKNYATVLTFAAGIVHDFAQSSATNPMLFVESLFKHLVPHRYCELVTNMYVSEELRMLAERELLMEEQERYERQVAAANDEEESADEEEELEFEDFGITSGLKSTNDKRGQNGKGDASKASDDADDDNPENAGEATNEKGEETGDVDGIENVPANGEERIRKRALGDSSSIEEEVEKEPDLIVQEGTTNESVGSSDADDTYCKDAPNEHGTNVDKSKDVENAPVNGATRIRKRETALSDEEDVSFDEGPAGDGRQSKRKRSILDDSDDDE